MLLRRLFCDDGGAASRAGGAGSERCCSKAKFSFACQKRTRKPPAIERLGGGEAMKAPVGLSSRQSGLRSKCRVFSAARTGIHEKGAARPFQTPKELSKPKNASRFAKRIFWASPVYGSADGVTFQQDFTFSKGVKSAAKQQIGETRKKCNSDDRRQWRKQG